MAEKTEMEKKAELLHKGKAVCDKNIACAECKEFMCKEKMEAEQNKSFFGF